MGDEKDWPQSLPREEAIAVAWNREVHFERANGDDQPILTIRQFFELLVDGRARYPQVVVNKNGAPADRRLYTTGRPLNTRKDAASVAGGYLNISRIAEEFSQGATIQLNDLQEYWEPAARLCRAISEKSGLDTAAIAILSPPGYGAFPVHQDLVHVFVKQLEGRKKWLVYKPLPDAHDDGPVTLPDGAVPAIEFVISPGDKCYMPPAWPHRAESLDEASLHLSVIASPPTGAEILKSQLREIHELLGRHRVTSGWSGSPAAWEFPAAVLTEARALLTLPQEQGRGPVSRTDQRHRLAAALGLLPPDSDPNQP